MNRRLCPKPDHFYSHDTAVLLKYNSCSVNCLGAMFRFVHESYMASVIMASVGSEYWPSLWPRIVAERSDQIESMSVHVRTLVSPIELPNHHI